MFVDPCNISHCTVAERKLLMSHMWERTIFEEAVWSSN
jgi:hypothetical protein